MSQLPATKIITELLPSTMHGQHPNFKMQITMRDFSPTWQYTGKECQEGQQCFLGKKITGNSSEKAVLNSGLYTAVPFPKAFSLKTSSEALLRV